MTIETIHREETSGLNVYYSLRNQAGLWLDFDDWTFKELVEVVEIGLIAEAIPVAAGRSNYTADLDLEQLAPGLPAVECLITCYARQGAEPAPLEDDILGQQVAFVAQLGKKGYRQFQTRVTLAATSTEGTLLQLMAWLEADGRKVLLQDLDETATCSVICKRAGNYPQFTISTADMGAVNADHCFEPTYANPNFTADRAYRAEAVIVASGLTFDGNLKTFSVLP